MFICLVLNEKLDDMRIIEAKCHFVLAMNIFKKIITFHIFKNLSVKFFLDL